MKQMRKDNFFFINKIGEEISVYKVFFVKEL